MSGGDGRSRARTQVRTGAGLARAGQKGGADMTSSFQIRRYARLGSTNDEARRLAAGGAPAGTVVVAAEQTAGRGRQGRAWTSPPGNLYASILVRPEIPAGRLGELALLTGVAVAETAALLLPPREAGPRVRLKWPNDVLVDGAKLAGILVEQEGRAAILGMGINVAHRPAGTPYPTTALALAGATAEVEVVLDRLLAALGAALSLWQAQGFAATRAAWMARAHPLGTMLRVRLGGPSETSVLEGRFAGLDPSGALLLDTAAGQRRIVAGEVAE